MNYKRIYDSIITHAQNNERTEYTEIHHIIPRCIGGLDDSDNLVKLTAREHFICHYLLTKIYIMYTPEWLKMNHAFGMMKCSSDVHERYFNSRLYEATREGRSLAISASQSGKTNSQFGTVWITNSIDNKKIKKNDVIPDGWIKGRTLNPLGPLSDEHKNKISAANKGKPGTFIGRKHSDETKAKISIARTGKPSNRIVNSLV